MATPSPKPARKIAPLSATHEDGGRIDPLSTTPGAPPPKSYATRSPGQVLAQQKLDAERDRAAKATAQAKKPESSGSTAVAPAQPTAVAPPDTRTPQQAYFDEIAPAWIVGRAVKFTKDGNFATVDDGEPIPEDATFLLLGDQTAIGWKRFHDDAPPEQIMGLLYDGFQMPPRASLGDTDPRDWPAGLSGAPADPYQHYIYLVLQQTETAELFTFVTASMTGRRAVGNLLRHYDRMLRTHPDELPVVRLKVGGFQHKDDRVGWVATPVFAVVGRAPRDSATKPDTSPSGDMDDAIPF